MISPSMQLSELLTIFHFWSRSLAIPLLCANMQLCHFNSPSFLDVLAHIMSLVMLLCRLKHTVKQLREQVEQSTTAAEKYMSSRSSCT